jgi:hypothetical protein
VRTGILIYFIAFARRDSGLESFHTSQKGRGTKRPMNLEKFNETAVEIFEYLTSQKESSSILKVFQSKKALFRTHPLPLTQNCTVV